MVAHSNPKVAIVHDYLRTFGGGERVVLALHEIWPEAPIFVATADYKRLGVFAGRFKKLDIRTSWAQKFPPFVKKPILYRPLLPVIWRNLDLNGYDIIISSSGSNISKGVTIDKDAMHICYCHTPPRFLYGYETETTFLQNPFLNIIAAPFVSLLRNFDKESSRNVDYFIANSKNVAERIKKIYKRKAIVIYPPCGLSKEENISGPGRYYLVVSRLIKYKHVELIINVADKLKLPLKIVGDGTLRKHLESVAGESIIFLGEVDDKTLDEVYHGCKVLIVTSKEEDFGITPVEAMSFGKPVIAYASGGLNESVIDGKTGILFKSFSEKGLIDAIKRFDSIKFDPKDCKKQASKFSKKEFKKKIKEFIESKWRESI